MTNPLPQPSDEIVERALHARVPGGAEVWHWLPMDGNAPHETARNVMSAALTELVAEVARLTDALKRANSNHEEFERRFYLEQDRAEELVAQMAGLKDDATQFRELLAVMHGDGGHYYAKHGARKARDDAEAKYYALIECAEAAERERAHYKARANEALKSAQFWIGEHNEMERQRDALTTELARRDRNHLVIMRMLAAILRDAGGAITINSRDVLETSIPPQGTRYAIDTEPGVPGKTLIVRLIETRAAIDSAAEGKADG